MLDADETRELRALQRRAYGRSGAVTDAEATRLQELESRGRAAATSAPAPHAAEVVVEARSPSFPGAVSRSGGSSRADDPLGQAFEAGGAVDPVRVPDDPAEQPTAQAATHVEGIWRTVGRHWRAVAAASAVLLAIGVGVGWALFAPRAHDVALTEVEIARQQQLYAQGDYDDGSLRAVARDGDALVWYATKSVDGADFSCLVLDVGELSEPNCVARDESSRMILNASVFVQDEGDGDDGSSGATSVNAYGMLSTSGEPMIAIQRWDIDDSMLDQFDDEERTRAAQLRREGYQLGFSLVGYFRDLPVWLAQRPGDAGTMQDCLVADAVAAVICLPSDGTPQELSVSSGDAADPWSLSVRFTRWGVPYLAVTERPVDGTTVVVDAEKGDPIEVTSPSAPDD